MWSDRRRSVSSARVLEFKVGSETFAPAFPSASQLDLMRKCFARPLGPSNGEEMMSPQETHQCHTVSLG